MTGKWFCSNLEINSRKRLICKTWILWNAPILRIGRSIADGGDKKSNQSLYSTQRKKKNRTKWCVCVWSCAKYRQRLMPPLHIREYAMCSFHITIVHGEIEINHSCNDAHTHIHVTLNDDDDDKQYNFVNGDLPIHKHIILCLDAVKTNNAIEYIIDWRDRYRWIGVVCVRVSFFLSEWL